MSASPIPRLAAADEPADGGAAGRPLRMLTGLLEQLRDVITLLPASAYLGRPAAAVSGSVGEHVRHCLDHVSALLAALSGEELSYDRRRRGSMVEIDPRTAIDEIERLFVRIDRLVLAPLDRPLRLWTLVDADGRALESRTTAARELAFVVQHTIHHCALIAVLLEWQGHRVPRDFGLAPATKQARQRAS